jgi:hypothetical protein
MAKTDVVKAFTNALEAVIEVQFNQHVATGFDKSPNQENLSTSISKFLGSLNDEQKASYLDLEELGNDVVSEMLERFYRLGIKDDG